MTKNVYDFKKFKEKFNRKSAVAILVAVGFIGILLIFISSFFKPSDGSKPTSTSDNSSQYAEQTEKRLEGIIGSINGVGRVKILVTVESGVENIYETDNKNSSQKQENTGQSSQVQETNSYEASHVIVDGSGGGQQALLTKQKEPSIKGVVIVCDGGNNEGVKESVIHSVSTALGLPTNRISVVKMDAKH